MPTVVRDLMSAPAVTCEAGTSLAAAARTMRDAGIGSIIVTERGKVAGILTERDLLRAPRRRRRAAGAESVELWMTANPDVLGPDEEVGRGLDQPGPSPVPAPAGGGRSRARRRGVVARPDGRGPAAPRRRARDRDPRRPRGRGGGGDRARRRPGRGGLLPLPPVLGGGPRGAAIARGRLVPAARRRAPRRRARRVASPPTWRSCAPCPRVGGDAARGGGAGLALRGPAHRGVAARGRAGVAPHP